MAFYCPTPADVLQAGLKLLPRGRAWQTNEGGPRRGFDRAFNPRAFNNDAFSTDAEATSVLRQYWAAVADVFGFLTQRLCALRLEFWCATQSETRAQWMREYGLPDACDPFPDLCTKVAAIGGTRCDYYQAIAARAGWSLQCLVNGCGARAGCARTGRMRTGRKRQQGYLHVLVDLKASSAYAGPARSVTRKAGRFRAGQHLTCNSPPVDLTPLDCLLARVVHAEIQIVYEVTNG